MAGMPVKRHADRGGAYGHAVTNGARLLGNQALRLSPNSQGKSDRFEGEAFQ